MLNNINLYKKEEMTISDCITNEIEKAREKSIFSTQKEVQGWIFSPQFLAILQIANVEVVRADSAYWCYAFPGFVAFLCARIAVDYSVRRKNRSIVQREWLIWWVKWVKGTQ